MHSPQSNLGESLELLSTLDASITSDSNEVSKYYPSTEENSTEVLPSKPSNNVSSAHSASTT